MSPQPNATESARESPWVNLSRAAQAAGLTPYSTVKAAAAGHVRTRYLSGFPTLYCAADLENLRQVLNS